MSVRFTHGEVMLLFALLLKGRIILILNFTMTVVVFEMRPRENSLFVKPPTRGIFSTWRETMRRFNAGNGTCESKTNMDKYVQIQTEIMFSMTNPENL